MRDKPKTAVKRAPARRARAILRYLKAEYPDARCSLDYDGAYQLIVAVVLSAQCTDAKVNAVIPKLFTRYPTPSDLAAARHRDIEAIIRPLGLFRSKARNIVALAAGIIEGVPRTMAELVQLPGVGRKTANVVLGEAFGFAEGIAVDTHCGRLARRLGLVASETPEKIERELMDLVPRSDWPMVTHLFIAHGRKICHAQRPRCAECRVKTLCPSRRDL